jgi:hypothetical protein
MRPQNILYASIFAAGLGLPFSSAAERGRQSQAR